MPLTAYGAVFSGASVTRAPEAGIEVFGRLLPDVTLSEAEGQLSGIASGLPGSGTAGDSSPRVRLDSRAGLGRMPMSDTLAVAAFVFAVITLVLLLACANVPTVLIATARLRRRGGAVGVSGGTRGARPDAARRRGRCGVGPAAIVTCSGGQTSRELEDQSHARVAEVGAGAVHHRARAGDHLDVVLTAVLDRLG
jgi:hypothetical protein